MSQKYRAYTPPTYLEKAEVMDIIGAVELATE